MRQVFILIRLCQRTSHLSLSGSIDNYGLTPIPDYVIHYLLSIYKTSDFLNFCHFDKGLYIETSSS